ncbi:heterokaryon incompatibility protein-domain-containing protein, partial [Daedaleopsis nitida]
MWFLNTETCELEWANDAKSKAFAILSHVWNQGGEQSFADIQNLQKSIVARTGRVAGHDRSIWYKTTDKIRNFCAFARKHGHQRVWVDTCCIDKSSSAELSEAINSMYDWYNRARVCYVYLPDVSDFDHPVTKAGSQIRRSKWFSRGWTLQELIAPRTLVFLSMEWTIIGTKESLAHLVEEITGIDADILVHKRSLDSVSVARRMSWASERQTTRVEDEAYCLMGIFGVKMPTIYGEGSAAFVRLQEEILKRTCDQTLFVW